jgi:exosortase/archaeosortase family protein
MQNLSNCLSYVMDWSGRVRRLPLAFLLPAAAASVLALDPVLWVVQTWQEPAYDSYGLLIAALVGGIAAWSLSSAQRRSGARHGSGVALGLLAGSALVRAAGQVGAINVLGALTLVLDVYALGLLARLDERQRAVSPLWLAAAFAFALPIERVLQRSLGYALQQVSAEGACRTLGGLYDNLICEGVRIVLDGRDVLVDVPCSGARMLMLTALTFAILAALTRPNYKQTLAGLALMMGSALAGNVVRIIVLAIGIAHPESLGGLDVMAAPWHDAIGLVALTITLLPLAVWARTVEHARPPASPTVHLDFIPYRLRKDGWWLETRPAPARRQGPPLWAGAVALVLALTIVNLPRRPIDVARRDTSLAAPAWIMGERGEPQALLPQETAYFTQHGGAAVKASYGPHNLLLVRTTSPLRHLHAPDECLRGLGYSVAYLGLAFDPVPTARYLATAPNGGSYRIDVSFVSNRGHVTGSVAGAVWHWLRGEAVEWLAVQRISSGDLTEASHLAWSASALAVLGIDPVPDFATQPKGDAR